MEELVSIIVNVYNCKEYLPKSLESVRQQTYQNLEVILVDDASTDGSGAYCDEFCQQDERFRVIHHVQNMGVSGPRNTGLKNAHGEYIYFLDGDDYIHAEAIEVLVNALHKTGLDLAIFDFYWQASSDGDIHYPRNQQPYEFVSADRMIFEMLSIVELKWCVVWNKLYKRSLIEGISFYDYYSIQDQDFNLRVYQRIEKAVFIPERLYWYFNNTGSLQRDTSLYPKKFYFNTMYRFQMLDHVTQGINEKRYRAWIIGYGYLQMEKRRIVERGTDFEVGFRHLSKRIIYTTGREFLFMQAFPFKQKLKFFIYWYFPHLKMIYKDNKISCMK